MYREILGIVGTANVAPIVDLKKPWIDNKLYFPKSYEHYVEELGYGLLCNLFIFYLPWAGKYKMHPDSWFVQNKEMKSLFDYYIQTLLSVLNEDDKELLKSAEPFAKSENGEFLFWNRSQILANNEMPIYCTDFSSGIHHVGNSLYDFICLVTGENYKSALKLYTNPLPSIFKPYKEIY